MLRHLRITVAVASLAACMLLFALWVRSYSWADSVSGRFTRHRALSVWSERGAIRFTFATTPYQIHWAIRTSRAYRGSSGLSRYEYFTPPYQSIFTHRFKVTVPYWLSVLLTG